MLVDEVLAVGDARFWSKSTARMRELNRQGTTIVLVSHNMWLMQTMASRAIWLRSGQVAEDGEPLKVISLYRQYSETGDQGREVTVTTEEPVRIGTVEMFPESRWASAVEALSDSGVRVVFPVEAAPGSNLIFLVRLTNPDGLPYFTVYSKLTQVSSRGRATVEAVIPHLMLMPGEYRLSGCSLL